MANRPPINPAGIGKIAWNRWNQCVPLGGWDAKDPALLKSGPGMLEDSPKGGGEKGENRRRNRSEEQYQKTIEETKGCEIAWHVQLRDEGIM